MALVGVKTLPKRAQQEIARLEASVEHWKAQALAATSADPKATNVALSGSGVDSDRGLPPNSVVIFRVEQRGRIREIEIRHEHGMVAIRSNDGMLLVRPAAANVIHVLPEE